MKRLYFMLLLTGCLLVSVYQLSRGQAASQYPIADKVADKIIHDCQSSSCQQLAEKKKQPPTAPKRRNRTEGHRSAQERSENAKALSGPD